MFDALDAQQSPREKCYCSYSVLEELVVRPLQPLWLCRRRRIFSLRRRRICLRLKGGVIADTVKATVTFSGSQSRLLMTHKAWGLLALSLATVRSNRSVFFVASNHNNFKNVYCDP